MTETLQILDLCGRVTSTNSRASLLLVDGFLMWNTELTQISALRSVWFLGFLGLFLGFFFLIAGRLLFIY